MKGTTLLIQKLKCHSERSNQINYSFRLFTCSLCCQGVYEAYVSLISNPFFPVPEAALIHHHGDDNSAPHEWLTGNPKFEAKLQALVSSLVPSTKAPSSTVPQSSAQVTTGASTASSETPAATVDSSQPPIVANPPNPPVASDERADETEGSRSSSSNPGAKYGIEV
jgi:hypothetical protein